MYSTCRINAVKALYDEMKKRTKTRFTAHNVIEHKSKQATRHTEFCNETYYTPEFYLPPWMVEVYAMYCTYHSLVWFIITVILTMSSNMYFLNSGKTTTFADSANVSHKRVYDKRV